MHLAVLTVLFVFLSTVYTSSAYIQTRHRPEADLAILKRWSSPDIQESTNIRLLKRVQEEPLLRAAPSGCDLNNLTVREAWELGHETRHPNVRQLPFRFHDQNHVFVIKVVDSNDSRRNTETYDRMIQVIRSDRVILRSDDDENVMYIAFKGPV